MLRYPKYTLSMSLSVVIGTTQKSTRSIAGLNLPDEVGSAVGTALSYIAQKYYAITNYSGGVDTTLITREEAQY